MMFKFAKSISMTGAATLALLAWAPANAQGLQVVSTFSIISDFASHVGGDRIMLTTLVPANSDAHSYEPKPTDAIAVGKADLVLANGLHFEGFLDRLIQATSAKAPVIVLTQGVELLRNTEDEHDNHPEDSHDDHDHHNQARQQVDSHEHDHAEEHTDHHHGTYDPHAWQSVRNAQIYVSNIATAFCAADASGCPTYQANAKAYDQKLQALDAELKAAVAQIPADQRTIITSHDAFGYLAHEYGLQFLAPQGINTGSEASAAGVASLIQQIKARKAPAIFVENVSNPRLIQQIASETGVNIGGKLYSDALSAAGGPASTYIDMMRHNVNSIRDAVLKR